jgi:acyl carrier protein
MTKEILEAKLTERLNNFIEENEIDISNVEIDKSTRLIGTNSVFDSMELVQFIVEIETLLEDEFNLEIELTSDKAMSQRNSPFKDINSLCNFIYSEIGK